MEADQLFVSERQQIGLVADDKKCNSLKNFDYCADSY